MIIGSKKLSIDLSDENRRRLEQIKEKTHTPYGGTINTLISTFCGLPDDMRSDLSDFCTAKLQMLCDQMDRAGGFELVEISATAKKYMDILSFFNDSAPVNLDTIRRKPRMETISIKDGVVVYPEDWIVVNPDAASKCRYAGVVECRNSDGSQIPHFLFFSDKKYAREYTDQEIAHINRICAHTSQIFAYMQERQVKPVPDPNQPGKYLNEKEYLDSPKIGHFHLYEQGDPTYPSDYDPPYGAKIIRT